MDPRYLYVTTHGHQHFEMRRTCTTASTVGECAAGLGVGRRDLHGYGPGLPLHQSIQHAAMHPVGQRPLRTYGYCGRCAVGP